MILFLVRHALTSTTGIKLTGRLPGFSLSERGTEQAEATAERLAKAPLKAVYSSPMERCLETAQCVAKHHGMKVHAVENLSEIDYGDWQGKNLKTLYGTKDWKALKARPADFRFPKGETIRQAQTRGVSAIEVLRLRHKEEAILVCSHADMIKLLAAAYLGMSIELYDRINIAPASITTIHLTDGAPGLLNLGEVGSYEEMFKALDDSRRKGVSAENGKR